MYEFVKTSTGWFHLITALIALILGAYMLATPKGTKKHKKVGYIYVLTMFLVCASAMCIYGLTGKFGIFHITAIIGFITIFCGMAPFYIPKFPEKYKAVHLWFMYYSVLGLYAAFASELLVRIPNKPFYTMVGIVTGSVFLLGTLIILKKQGLWSMYFDDKK